jgi:hypothetical protein
MYARPPNPLTPFLNEAVDFLACAPFCHPYQVSEAQAVANSRRDRGEVICVKRRGKKRERSALIPRLRSRKMRAALGMTDGKVPR